MKSSIKLSSSGFSLVEVSLAMAIAALGLVAILGLLPQGLEMSRKTGLVSSQRHIVEQIIRGIEQTKWSEIVDGTTLQKFDNEGSPLIGADDKWSYLANVEIPIPDSKLPSGSAAGGAPELYLRRVAIKVATTTKSEFDFSEDNYRNYTTFYHYIAKGR